MASREGRVRRITGRGIGSITALGVAMFVVGLIALVGLLGGFTKTTGGEVAVVRNGGPFDNHRIRQTIQPASAVIV